MALTVTQLDRGGANGVTSFSTANVAAASNRLLILDLYFQPASPPVTLSPSVSGYGATWVREDDPAFDAYETMQRWRCEISSGSTDTVDLSWTGTCDVLWSLFEVSGHVTGNNGADAFVQTVRAASNAVTLADFADASNECLTSFTAGYFPDPDGTVDSTLTQVGTTAASNPGLFLELISGLGPEQVDDVYSATWVGQFIQRAVASEIAVASGGTHDLGATGAESATNTGSAALGQVHALTGSGASSTTNTGTSAVGQVQALSATGASSTTSTGASALGQSHALTATGASSATSAGSAAVGQVHALGATGAQSATETGTANLGDAPHELGATGTESASAAGVVALGQVHALGAAGASSVTASGSAAAGQVHALVAVGASSATVAGAAELNPSAYERAPAVRTATAARETRRLVAAAESRVARAAAESRRSA